MKSSLTISALALGQILTATGCTAQTPRTVAVNDCDLGDRFEHDTDCLQGDWLNKDGSKYRPGIDPVEGVPESDSKKLAKKFKGKVPGSGPFDTVHAFTCSVNGSFYGSVIHTGNDSGTRTPGGHGNPEVRPEAEAASPQDQELV